MNKKTDNIIDDQLIDLEIRLTHQEDHIQSLDKIIYEQDKLLSALLNKVKQIDNKLKESGESNILPTNEETPPPHY